MTGSAFLLPLFWQDYYALPTAAMNEKPFDRTPNHCNLDETAVVSGRTTWQAFVEELRLCDTVTSLSPTILFLANGMSIPHRTPTGTELYDKVLVKRTNRPVNHIGRDHSLYLPGLIKPDRIRIQMKRAKKMASSRMPYRLFTTAPTTEESKAIHSQRKVNEGIDERILVIMMGSVRGGESTWETFYEHMLDLNGADLALVVGEASASTKATSLWKRAKYKYEFSEHDDWAETIDEVSAPERTDWRDVYLPYADPKWGLWGGVNGTKGSGAIIFMIREYVKDFLLSGTVLDDYDRFVVTRSDHYYACDHNVKTLDQRFLWVPKGEDYRSGITDRHVVANRAQILPALSILGPIIKYPHKHGSTAFSWLNPERLIRHRWEREKLWEWVRRFPRTMFTCAVPGDTSRWAAPEFNQEPAPEGVFPKYPMEYEEARCVCGQSDCTFTRLKQRARTGYN